METLKNLPMPMKVGAGAAGAGGLLGLGMAAGAGNWKLILVLVIAVVILLAVLLGGFLLIKAWQRKKRNARLSGELAQHSSASPRSISDPGKRARLDDLRKKFQEGVEAYRSRGKDLYKLPWYVIVGEPGSGKTEAVRHSNVGFPPGMQDEFQGVGGTINMNWWFTNHAVILDTAGRLMFEEVAPGETSEWKEFLTLLKKNRPGCPVNGLFLVIPSDSLITDTADAIAKKAGKIAQQLDVIQRVLDVRFPVFVLVTKCDKINGFREYFDGLSDPQMQHQMLGWSNPESLDTVFRPELVGDCLDKVAERLRRRRMTLMRDPVPESAGRRADEVDALYALPHSLELLGSRLKRYLETIFVAGEWSAKPLFLRGIYFSSSMREGSALDQDLAEAIGVAPDALPEGKVWERDRAYFLRDLFMEKAFRERNLVTRSSNAAQMLRRQQAILLTGIFVAIGFFVAMSWFGMRNLGTRLQAHSEFWNTVADVGWETNKVWKQALIPFGAGGTYQPAVTREIKVAGETMSLGEFHAALRKRVEQPIETSWMVGGIAKNYQENSTNAQRVVFETGIVKPLVQAARQKMMEDKPSPSVEAARRQAAALVTLLELESDIAAGGPGTNTFDIQRAQQFLGSLLSYYTDSDYPADGNFTNLAATMAWTYERGPWPPATLTGMIGLTNTLAFNPAMRAGVERFVADGRLVLTQVDENWVQAGRLRDAIRSLQRAEGTIHTEALSGRFDSVKQLYPGFGSNVTAVAEELRQGTNSQLFATGLSFTNAQQRYRELSASVASGAMMHVRHVAEAALVRATNHALFMAVLAKVREGERQLSEHRSKPISRDEQAVLKSLDETELASMAGGGVAVGRRVELYRRALQLKPEKEFDQGKLVGMKGQEVGRLLADANAVQNSMLDFLGPGANQFTNVGISVLRVSIDRNVETFATAYAKQAASELNSVVGFPLIQDKARTLEGFQVLAGLDVLNVLSADFTAFTTEPLKRLELMTRPEWRGFAGRVSAILKVWRTLMLPTGSPSGCTVNLLKARPEDAGATFEKWREAGRVSELDPPGGTKVDSELGGLLGRITVDRKMQMKLYQSDKSPEPLKTFATPDNWGPIHLLLDPKNKSSRIAGAPNKWRVNWVITHDPINGVTEGAVPLEITFEEGELPDLKDWPTR
jgi:hypothetical protein